MHWPTRISSENRWVGWSVITWNFSGQEWYFSQARSPGRLTASSSCFLAEFYCKWEPSNSTLHENSWLTSLIKHIYWYCYLVFKVSVMENKHFIMFSLFFCFSHRYSSLKKRKTINVGFWWWILCFSGFHNKWNTINYMWRSETTEGLVFWSELIEKPQSRRGDCVQP